MWQTNAVALRAGGEAMLIDSPYFPDELEALPGLLAGAGFEPDALIATHGDFDHLLGRLAFPGLAVGLGESTVERFHREPGAAQRDLRDEDEKFYVERPRPLALGQVQTLPVPGSVELGPEELELYPAEGHTPDGLAVMARWCGVLCPGDYLSRVEIPMIHPGGSLDDYRSTLARLAPLVEAADTVVPGHGSPNDRDDGPAPPRRGRRLSRCPRARGRAPCPAGGARRSRAARYPPAQPGEFALVRPGHR